MNKKISVSIALAITILAMTVTFSITMIVSMRLFDNTVPAITQKQVLNNKIVEIDKYVRGNYFGTIEDNYLGDRTARGYLDGLNDAYSRYYSAEEYNELLDIQSQKLVSIGLEIIKDANGYYVIAKVYDDSPAAKARLTANGRIVSIDGVETKTMSSVFRVHSALRGNVGTIVNLTCLYNDSETKEFEIQRDNYTTPTIIAETQSNITYLRITALGPNTYVDFDYEVRKAINAGTKGFIFDVRGTSGTQDLRATSTVQYDQVYNMLDMLCPLGTIAKSESKNGTEKLLKTSDAENVVELPMVVLVNSNTSGPSELFAAKIRDLCGGVLVGTKTAGRGMLQNNPQRMSDGSAVTITTAKLLTDDGVSFDGVGLLPDVEETIGIESESGFYNINQDTDKQLKRSYEALRSLAANQGVSIPAPSTSGVVPAEPSTSAPVTEEGGEDISSVSESSSSTSS